MSTISADDTGFVAMRFLFICLVFAVFDVNPAQSQYVESTGASEEHFIAAHLDIVIDKILESASSRERAVASTIKVVVFPFHPSDFLITPRAGLSNSGERTIVFNDAFLLFLEGYLEAVIMGDVTNDPALPERWAHRHFAQVLMLNQSEMALPGRFIGWSDQRIGTFRENSELLFQSLKLAVITDFLLHEIGHHVLDAFYDVRTDDPDVMKAAERAADKWASGVFEKFASDKVDIVDKLNSSGRAFALSAMREIDAFLSSRNFQASRTHPSSSSRILAVLVDGGCADNRNQPAMKLLCLRLTEMAQSLEADDAGLDTYSKRANAGEAFASYRLGQVLLSRGDLVAACDQFQEAYDRGQKGWNLRFLAWCFEPESPTGKSNNMLAEDLYYQAAEDGWVEAQAWVRKFGSR